MEDARMWLTLGVGSIGGIISAAFGGWSPLLTIFVGAMCIDYILGLVVAGVFHRSKKSQNGALESLAGWKGLCRKGAAVLIVWLACQFDVYLGSSFMRDAACISFITNEIISITENMGLMGVPMPKVITKAIDMLTSKNEEEK